MTCNSTRSVIVHAMANVGMSHMEQGRYQEALVLMEKALELMRRNLPENHPQIGVGRFYLILLDDFVLL